MWEGGRGRGRGRCLHSFPNWEVHDGSSRAGAGQHADGSCWQQLATAVCMLPLIVTACACPISPPTSLDSTLPCLHLSVCPSARPEPSALHRPLLCSLDTLSFCRARVCFCMRPSLTSNPPPHPRPVVFLLQVLASRSRIAYIAHIARLRACHLARSAIVINLCLRLPIPITQPKPNLVGRVKVDGYRPYMACERAQSSEARSQNRTGLERHRTAHRPPSIVVGCLAQSLERFEGI